MQLYKIRIDFTEYGNVIHTTTREYSLSWMSLAISLGLIALCFLAGCATSPLDRHIQTPPPIVQEGPPILGAWDKFTSAINLPE